MFLVGGGIFTHTVPFIHHFVEGLQIDAAFLSLVDLAVGVVIGAIACLIVLPLMKLFGQKGKA